MEDNKHLSIALSDIDFVYEDNPLKIVKKLNICYEKCTFDKILDRKDWMWLGLNGIIRTSAFLQVYPDRNIPNGAGGQNCQMYMPLIYKYQYGIINKCLAKYVIRKNSHSRQNFIFAHRSFQFCEIWLKTIFKIDTTLFNKLIYCSRVIRNELINILKHYIKKFLMI